jgi:hypothetical protein
VTVRAHELTFRDLVEHELFGSLARQVTEWSHLRGPGEVVPFHRFRREDDAAVGARLADLQRPIPLLEGLIASPAELPAALPDPLEVLGVIDLPARLAPELVAISRGAMERVERFALTASTASLHAPKLCDAQPQKYLQEWQFYNSDGRFLMLA